MPTNFNLISGDSVTVQFSYTFQLPTGSAGADIQIYVINPAGVVTPITGLGNYTININTSQVNYPITPGIAPMLPGQVALQPGWKIAIYRIENITQGLNLLTQSVIPSLGVMAALDLLTMICQQLNEVLTRCFQLPIGQTLASDLASAFIAAVQAGILTTPPTGTYAYLKGIAAANPTQWTFGIATDQGKNGENLVFWYCGNTTVGDNGWFLFGG